jgi:leukotriene-A4 hydrolase
MSRLDPHSFFDSDQPRTRHLALEIGVDFGRQRVAGRVTLDLGGPSSGPLDLDTKGLVIASAASGAGTPIPYALGSEEPILGRRLRLDLPPGTAQVVIAYETGPEAVGLQWLAPEQTAGKRHPFMFTQFQPIHARTMIPCQDTPIVRATFSRFRRETCQSLVAAAPHYLLKTQHRQVKCRRVEKPAAKSPNGTKARFRRSWFFMNFRGPEAHDDRPARGAGPSYLGGSDGRLKDVAPGF